jgi:ketosteroid isomerase-like protein
VSGLAVEIALTTVYTLREGKIVRVDSYETKLQALEAVGLRD